MKICPVTDADFSQAVEVYRASWQESHRDLCTPEFLERRDCAAYLRDGTAAGKKLYMLWDGGPVGIIALRDGEIGDLYVLPERQGRGYGTALLQFGITHCGGNRLTVLSGNTRAAALYQRLGFRETGRKAKLREDLWELEMRLPEQEAPRE